MDRRSARNGEIRTGGNPAMPRAPFTGLVAGLAGALWAAAGLLAAAWAATAAIDAAKGVELAAWVLDNSRVHLPYSPDYIAAAAMDHLPEIGVAAAIALLIAWSRLRKARIAFRPGNVSQDGKGELRLSAMEPRVGRPFDGTIMLRDAPTPGEEFDVVLTAVGAGGAAAYRAEQKARPRPGAHGVNLPFRFAVPASAPASDGAHRWRLEFAPAGRKHFTRSAFDVSVGPLSEAEARMLASAPASPPALAPQSQGYVEHLEKLYGAIGGKLTDRQRELIRAKLSGPEAEAVRQQLEGLRKLRPEHMKLLKFAAIGAVVFFVVLPFVFSALGMILAAIFGQ